MFTYLLKFIHSLLCSLRLGLFRTSSIIFAFLTLVLSFFWATPTAFAYTSFQINSYYGEADYSGTFGYTPGNTIYKTSKGYLIHAGVFFSPSIARGQVVKYGKWKFNMSGVQIGDQLQFQVACWQNAQDGVINQTTFTYQGGPIIADLSRAAITNNIAIGGVAIADITRPFAVDSVQWMGPLTYTKTSKATVTINSGDLSISAPSVTTDFSGVTLNGRVQKVYATLSNWQVIDATGSGNGWSVNLSASQLSEVPPSGGFASGTTAKLLPKGSLSLTGSRSVTANSGSKPISSTGGPLLENIGSPIDNGTSVQILKSNADYGLGTYTVNEPPNGLLLTLNPNTVEVDTLNYPNEPTPFESTLTYTVTSGP